MIKNGIGYDAHQLGEGESLVIGGVKIASKLGSIGHSDGDVLIHAIIDAILGATASGDIGLLFPSDNIKYKNFHSGDFLKIVKKEILNKALNGSDLPVNKLLEMREKTVIITDQDI